MLNVLHSGLLGAACCAGPGAGCCCCTHSSAAVGAACSAGVTAAEEGVLHGGTAGLPELWLPEASCDSMTAGGLRPVCMPWPATPCCAPLPGTPPGEELPPTLRLAPAIGTALLTCDRGEAGSLWEPMREAGILGESVPSGDWLIDASRTSGCASGTLRAQSKYCARCCRVVTRVSVIMPGSAVVCMAYSSHLRGSPWCLVYLSGSVLLARRKTLSLSDSVSRRLCCCDCLQCSAYLAHIEHVEGL